VQVARHLPFKLLQNYPEPTLQPRPPSRFNREHGITQADWLATLPGAVRDCRLELPTALQAVVAIGAGTLTLNWQVLPERRGALVSLPRLAVGYEFADVDDDARARFMRYFDLYIQRGGG
jgi:hypothetical protein